MSCAYKLDYTEDGKECCIIEHHCQYGSEIESALEECRLAGSAWTDVHLYFEDGEECLEFPALLEQDRAKPEVVEPQVLESEQAPSTPVKKPKKSWLSSLFDFDR